MKLIGGLNLTDETSASLSVACERGEPAAVALVDRLEKRRGDVGELNLDSFDHDVYISQHNRLRVSAIEACGLVGWIVMVLTELEQDTGFEYYVEVRTAMEW